MTTYMTISAAYGRQYTEASVIHAHWLAGKDFTIRSGPEAGRLINREDAETMPGLVIKVRYDRNREVCVLWQSGGTWILNGDTCPACGSSEEHEDNGFPVTDAGFSLLCKCGHSWDPNL